MLTVYTVPIQKQRDWIDLSSLPLDDLVPAALAVLAHQTSAVVWFGYLEGTMLTPQEETRLRPVLRAFPCHLVCTLPLFLPYAWKTDVETIYTTDPNGAPDSHDNGGAVRNGRSVGHDNARGTPPSDVGVHQTGKARRTQARRVQKGSNSASQQAIGSQANDGVRSQ